MKLDREMENGGANTNKTAKVDLFSFMPTCLKSGKAKSISMTVYTDTLPSFPLRSSSHPAAPSVICPHTTPLFAFDIRYAR